MAVIVREKVKGSGEWWVFVNHKKKRKSKKIGDKKTANNVAKAIREKLAKGDLGMLRKKRPGFAKYGQEWLDSPLREQAESTLAKYQEAFDLHIKPHFGSKSLDEIKRRHVKAFIGKLRGRKLSTSRSQVILSVLSGIFENAVEDEIVDFNPCQKVRKYCGKDARKKINHLTATESQETLNNARKLKFVVYAAYLVAVRTGLRLGELLALEWTDFDFENRTVEVSKTYDYHLYQTRPPKNNKTRKVDLTPTSVEALRKLRKHSKVTSISGLVFTDDKGKRLNYAYLERKLKEVAPRPVRFHSLLHSYANLRISKGDNILDVSKQLGHHSVAFTIDRYGHWMPGEHKGQVDELDSLHLSAPYTHLGESEKG